LPALVLSKGGESSMSIRDLNINNPMSQRAQLKAQAGHEFKQGLPAPLESSNQNLSTLSGNQKSKYQSKNKRKFDEAFRNKNKTTEMTDGRKHATAIQ